MPADIPPSSRLVPSTIGRWSRLLRPRQALPCLLVAGAVAGVALGAPMASSAVTSFSEPVALESTSAAADADGSGWAASSGGSAGAGEAGGSGGGVVQMGVDGAPAPATDTPVTSEAPATPDETAATAAASEESAAAADEPAPASSAAATEKPEPAGTPAPAPASSPAPAPAPAARTTAAPPADPSAEGQVLALVNQERAAAGCAPVVADAPLAAVARAHSADMRDRDFFSHTNPEGLSPFDRAERAGISYSRAENIAYGQRDAAAVMEAWMNSSGHRANILDCGLTKLGVGVAEGAGGPWWTQLFGS
jgi:uncharacterized protein YkwD